MDPWVFIWRNPGLTLRLQGCCRGCFAELCAQPSWGVPLRRETLEQSPLAVTAPTWAAALSTSAPGNSPAHSIAQALTTKASGIFKRHHRTMLSRGGNQTLGWTSPVCRLSLFSCLPCMVAARIFTAWVNLQPP